jgi:hypothetical protein
MIGVTAGAFCAGVAAATHISKPKQAFIISSVLNLFKLTPSENEEAVRNLRRTVFSSQCRPIAGSLKRRVYCFILTGQREPGDGHREMKFAQVKLACFLSSQQRRRRIIAIALPIVHGTLHSPRCVSARSHLRWWLGSGNGALIDRRGLYKIAHQAIKVARYPCPCRKLTL